MTIVSLPKQLFLLVLFCGCSQLLFAQDYALSAQLKYQLTGAFAPPRSIQRELASSALHAQEIDARVNFESRSGPLQLVVHGEILGIGGTELEYREAFLDAFANLRFDLGDRRRLFDLSKQSLDDSQFELFHRVDRAELGYYGEKTVAKLGRQVYSLGNGLTFQVLDLLNPFSPVEIDKDYKTGEDLVYVEHLFDSGASVELLSVLRRNELGNTSNAVNSYAGVYQTTLAATQSNLQFFAAEHFEEFHLGVGSSTDIAESVLRADIVFARSEGSWVPSVVVNIDRSWLLFGKNAYGFIEYYRNGFGVADQEYLSAEQGLIERQARGELFTLGRDFLAAGVQLELSPLTNIFMNQILHLNDGSVFHQLRLQYDLSQESSILIGFNLPQGAKRSEFGGIEVLPERFARPSRTAYARLSFFF